MCCAPHRCHKHQAHLLHHHGRSSKSSPPVLFIDRIRAFYNWQQWTEVCASPTWSGPWGSSLVFSLPFLVVQILFCWLDPLSFVGPVAIFWGSHWGPYLRPPSTHPPTNIRSQQDVDDSEMLGFAGPWGWTDCSSGPFLIVFDKPTQPIFKKKWYKQMFWAPNRILKMILWCILLKWKLRCPAIPRASTTQSAQATNRLEHKRIGTKPCMQPSKKMHSANMVYLFQALVCPSKYCW